MREEDKILLKVDDRKIKEIEKSAVNSVTSLNNLIKECEKVCKTTFTKAERNGIRDKGMDFIKEYLKPKFQFPNGDEDVNLKILGIDLQPLETYMKRNFHYWRDYPIEQNEKGVFELVAEPEQIKNCYTYTENERQLRGYNLAVSISDLINTAIEEKFIPENLAYKMILFGDILTANSHQTRAIPNPDRISRIK